MPGRGVPLILLLFVFVVLSSSCGSSTNSSSLATATPAATPDQQPVSSSQLLRGPVTYVALGASDAVGVGSRDPGTQGYVPLLKGRLPSGSRLVNLGISGIQLHQALTRELPLVRGTAPQLITIWLVANDFVANVPYASYMQDLETLLKQLRAETKARIAMANLPDLARLPSFAYLSTDQKSTMQKEIRRWNATIASLAARYHIAPVDLFSQDSQLTAHPEYVSGDGFHPSPAGYAKLADYFWQAITSR